MLCDLCKSIEQNVRSKTSHERLRQIGIAERLARLGRTKAAWVTHFECELCGTHWRHEDDRHNSRAGYSIEGAPTSAE